MLAENAKLYPGKVALKVAFNDALAHKIEAASDFFLMPSRYEPCGLNQLISLKYGTVPIVNAVGGLEDTIEDFDPDTGTGTGFKMGAAFKEELIFALKRASDAYAQPKVWGKLVKNCMKEDFSWTSSAKEY